MQLKGNKMNTNGWNFQIVCCRKRQWEQVQQKRVAYKTFTEKNFM